MLVDLADAVKRLKQGDIVAMPTETVYGLAARMDNEDALKKIFSTKQRPFFDPLIVHVSDLREAKALAAEWPAVYDILANAFWPGPLTLICKKKSSVSSLITSGLETVGLRVPKHPLALELIQKVGAPLAAPSANRFGRTSPTSAQHVESEFESNVAVLDGGNSEVGLESTVLRAQPNGKRWIVEIFRPGGISREMIRQTLKEAGVTADVTRLESQASPGHLKEHYQPTQPLVILSGVSMKEVDLSQMALELVGRRLEPIEMKLPAMPFEAARTLYSEMRRLSTNTEHLIVVERKPQHFGEDWEAIWDRLERAASRVEFR